MSDDTSTISILGADPERVVSVTVGELRKAVTTGWHFNDYGLVHERMCRNSAPHYLRFRCSECHYVIYHDDANETGEPDEDRIKFCPNCGSRVIGGDE